jgi:hypothetical protein
MKRVGKVRGSRWEETRRKEWRGGGRKGGKKVGGKWVGREEGGGRRVSEII